MISLGEILKMYKLNVMNIVKSVLSFLWLVPFLYMFLDIYFNLDILFNQKLIRDCCWLLRSTNNIIINTCI